MAQAKIKSPKAAACLFFGLIFLSGVIVFFIIGGIFFGKEHPKVLNYANAMCQVDSRSWTLYQCETRYYYYTCYGPIWEVHYIGNMTGSATVEIDHRYSTITEAINKADEYLIGDIYSCWYDTRNPTTAQWDRPSILVASILLGCGGLCMLIALGLFFLTHRFIQEFKLQSQQNYSSFGENTKK